MPGFPFVLAIVLQIPAAEVTEIASPILTVEECLELSKRIRPSWPTDGGWLDGSQLVTYAPVDPAAADDDTRGWFVVDARTGARRPLFDVARMAEALGAQPGVSAEQAHAWSTRDSCHFSAAKDAVLLNEAGDLFHYRFGSEQATRLTHDPQEEVGETLSPDGSLVGYIHDFNLHVVATDGSAPRALTAEGDAEHALGRLDWVYQEEIYGRGNWQGYWWSPDSQRIAFLALDESAVPAYTVVDHRQNHPDVELWRYPKAGDPNPRVRVGVVDAAGGKVRYLDLSRYDHDEILVVRVGFTPDSRQVIVQVQDRVQTWLDVIAADPATGATTRLFRDQTPVWIEPTDAPFFTADGEQFVWLSERDGFRHLYLYARNGELIRRLTSGAWEVDKVHGIDPATHVWFDADRDDVKGERLYRVGLDGEGLAPVGAQAGTHAISLSPTFEFFRDDFSAANDPGHVAIHRADGSEASVLARGTTEPLAKFALNPVELMTVKTRDGVTLNAMMIKPRDYQAGRRYPVLTYIYGGPHAPQVLDRFFTRDILWHHLLAQRGYLIWVCDNRSASGRGLQSVAGVYRNLGEQELADLEDSLQWLIDAGFADPARIGLWGWSYGGFMTAYALTHSQRFKMGIAGAPVTDWHLYDSIYTERYMHLPQVNVDGYAKSSVVGAAADLHGQLLLIHGTIDENVHMQNTLQFAKALQDAGRPFDLMLYPGNRHSVRDPKQRRHLYQMMADYVIEHL